GFGVVPWTTHQPLYDTVEAGEADPAAKKNLAAMRSIVSTKGLPSLLAMLDYLDADPADHFGVRDKFFQGWKELLGREPGREPRQIEGFQAPALVSPVEPIYPDIARRARIEGTVFMTARIGKEGSVGSLHLLSASNPMFTEPAFAAVRQWRYTPGTLKGEAIEVPNVIRVDFRLR
ncbi:MAG TPA: energy transducer TonB, partial [Candidatus Polarisedimenticolaceae bacterium]|nr:energy transducer TonB [Candidatus Polarisedimenticolaceae bacterium]